MAGRGPVLPVHSLSASWPAGHRLGRTVQGWATLSLLQIIRTSMPCANSPFPCRREPECSWQLDEHRFWLRVFSLIRPHRAQLGRGPQSRSGRDGQTWAVQRCLPQRRWLQLWAKWASQRKQAQVQVLLHLPMPTGPSFGCLHSD